MFIRSLCLTLCATLLSLEATAALGATLTLSHTSVSCPKAFVDRLTMCGTVVTATASGGSVTLRATAPLTVVSIVGWVNTPQQCSAGKVLPDGGSCTFGIGMNSASAGTFSNAWTLHSVNANSPTVTASIQVIGLSASGLSENCGAVTLGGSKSCGSLTLTASGGTVVLGGGAPVSSSNPAFTLPIGNCTAGRSLASGQSCTTGVITFSPQTVGTHTASINVVTTAATLSLPVIGSAYTYAWQSDAWTPEGACSDSVAQTRTVVCKRNDNATAADSFCGAEPKPSTSRTVSDFSGCTYEWETSAYGVCAGGAGQWMFGDWAPSTGCGATSQTRSVTCALDLNSGSRTRTVLCRRSDGGAVEDAQCPDADKPTLSETCTPTDLSLCGSPPAGNQTVTLNDGCDGSEDSGNSGGSSTILKQLCMPDAANHKYCVYSPL